MNITPHPLAQAAPTPVKRETIQENGRTVEVFPLDCRVTILSPTYGDVTVPYLDSYAAVREQCLARFRLDDGSIAILPIVAGRLGTVGDSHVDRARNVTANIWAKDNPLNTRFGYWWDVDIPVAPAQFMELWRLALLGYRFFGGIYACKNLVPTFIANIKDTSKRTPNPDGMVEVLHLGTGSMMWHLDVIRALESHPEVKPYSMAPNTPWPWRTMHAYFSSGVYGVPEKKTGLPQWQSEDWKVCMLWQELGGNVYAAEKIKLQHQGTLTYPPTVSDLVAATVAMVEQNHPAVDLPRLARALGEWRELPAPDLPVADSKAA